MKRDCPKLKKQADEKRDDSSKSANVVQNDDSDCSDGDILSISTNQYVDAWILDSGCSYHITPNREWFSSYRSGNSGSVYLGDDRCCNIVGVGDVRIKMYDGTVRTLSDVRHIPDLKKNLISLGTLHKNGFIPKADEDRETIRIVKGALTMMKGKITAGNIYKLLGNTVVGGVHSVDSCDDNTKLWHMRLVFAKFKLWKAEVENQTGRKIKYLRSDNGTEYTNSQFQKFCEEHGIQRHFSMRKTPQQNGVAERMNRSLTERARCLRLNAGLPKSFWAEAVSMACYLINRSPWASLGGKIAKEAYNLARDRQRRTNVKPPSRLGYEDMVSFALLVSGDEPTTFHGAITSQEKKEWMGAMVEEMESLHKNQTWELVQLPEGKKTIGCNLQDNGTSDLTPTCFRLAINSKMYDVLALKALLSQEFDMKYLGAATKILGMEIHRDRGSRKLWLSQRGYVEKVLDRSGMSKAKPVSTPMANHFKLSIDSVLRQIVRHRWETVKWIFRYLKGTVGHGIIFGSQQNDPLVVGYVDSDYAGDLDDRRSTTEYMAIDETAKEALWLSGLLKELGVEQGGVQLHCESQSAIYLAKNQVYHARTKHIDVRYHKIRELIASGEIILHLHATSAKSNIIISKATGGDASALQAKVGLLVGSLFIKYFGVLLSSNLNITNCALLLDKINSGI
ncbi:Retrovirus-related Pol polyprotein from transposon TNT 1-94 [Sesamum angolense]|uniref:Retrovirus-related Pol polyprotein from transposon TNT 1-94 n=1 Tax=Sesamum angolense TaxID=2727404 RepID=A0AAE1WX06_9LAMI|nr:Retrovirus-related Pol polyprotein from transposon TNT 1-94 [Sesamum angolense]